MPASVNQANSLIKYCNSLTRYSRRLTREVKIGDIPLGAHHPIRVQSMTTTDTLDTEATVAQVIRMAEAGCEYVRITAPSVNEARNLENIKKELRRRGCTIPLIADIHFTPNAAELAARIVQKVRINPGNYADKKKFENIRYTDDAYQSEIDRIREKFIPLVRICKEYGTAMRIGTNHGSLSDRIMSRYGDTPLGMVESALEFLRICEDLDYHDIVLSMKASNPLVMIQAYRLLVNKLDAEDMQPYPLHLGVTEAGDGQDGRIKSALGIGVLLEDGLGDTIRVSLTEEPEEEIPVARYIVNRYTGRGVHAPIPEVNGNGYHPFIFERRKTREVVNIGGKNVPRVIADLCNCTLKEYADLCPLGHIYDPETDKFRMNDSGVDFVYTGNSPAAFRLPAGIKELVNYRTWQYIHENSLSYPVYNPVEYLNATHTHPDMNFILMNIHDLSAELISRIGIDRSVVLIITTENAHGYAEQRRLFLELMENQIDSPVIIAREYRRLSKDEVLIYSSTDIGGLLADGFGDGIMLIHDFNASNTLSSNDWLKFNNETCFGILQAARSRITRTEYISCPSCGRTLFDLQVTTSAIRKLTDHLKGVKIAIMGCIVNGPGEMADADYGYVGSGKGRISLYRGKEIIKRNVPAESAVDELINLIKTDGRWIEREMSLN
ncbi:MAG TPA: (E)-4-hydroxy-3-methylbut-2-enyl-diphosphate synthase [Cyclobacteriaceae bacterium]|nr:(E)-4-hydroxy-3-methylbut-2-enyl-diphosphate synthase [Cyclobacteriaceae bacterium]